MFIIVIALISCFSEVVYAANKVPQWDKVEKEQQWACYDFREYIMWESRLSNRSKPQVIVTLKWFNIDGRPSIAGKVEIIGGTEQIGIFRFDGINREWSFGKNLEYKIVLRPNKQASYYDFRGIKIGEKTKANQHFYCEQR